MIWGGGGWTKFLVFQIDKLSVVNDMKCIDIPLLDVLVNKIY